MDLFMLQCVVSNLLPMLNSTAFRKVSLLALLLPAFAFFLIPNDARAQIDHCDCVSVWEGSFVGDTEALQEIQTQTGSTVFCTDDFASCQQFCSEMKAVFQDAVSTPEFIPRAPAVDCSAASSSVSAEGCKPGGENFGHPDCKLFEENVAGTGAQKGGTVKLKNPLGTSSVPELIGNILNVVLGIVGAVALLMFIYGGLLWLTSGGSADKVNKGKEVMVWASIGLLIIFSSSALVRFVLGAFSRGL